MVPIKCLYLRRPSIRLQKSFSINIFHMLFEHMFSRYLLSILSPIHAIQFAHPEIHSIEKHQEGGAWMGRRHGKRVRNSTTGADSHVSGDTERAKESQISDNNILPICPHALVILNVCNPTFSSTINIKLDALLATDLATKHRPTAPFTRTQKSL